MKIRIPRYVPGYSIAFLLVPCAFFSVLSEEFPVPDIIRDNVVFWRKIYSEVSLKEGLLHDREYPKVIYEKVRIGNRTGADRTAIIDARRKVYADIITAIQTKPDSQLTSEEREVKTLYMIHANNEALEGAQERIRFQTGQKERFQLGLERSYMYLDTIVAILRHHHVPERLKYLPHVESSFDFEAYSRVGAAGMWQFMPSTGKLFLRVDYSIDERLDPIRSTVAAAKLLRKNYKALDSWALAITAYNHGLAGMRRAVASTGSNDIAVILQRHESPSFKFASKNFYACFIAAAALADSAEHFFPDLSPYKRFEAVTFTLPAAAPPSRLINSLQISEELFRQYNPAFRSVVFKQQRQMPAGYVINLPPGTETAAVHIALSIPRKPSQPADLSADYYTVSRGDNLTTISRRLGVSVHELARFNSISKIHRIYEGQVLRIPPLEERITTVATADIPAVSPAAETAAPTEGGGEEPALPEKPEPQAPAEQEVSTEEPATVQVASVDDTTLGEPDTLFTAFTDTVPLTDTTLLVEMTVLPDTAPEPSVITDTVSVPVSITATAKPRFSRETGAVRSEPGSRFDAGVYDLGIEVAPGGANAVIRVGIDETMSHYAEWMRVSIASIQRFNEMKGTRIRIGQRLKIPVGQHSDIKIFEVSRLEYHMANEEDFYSRYKITGMQKRLIRPGETVLRISNRSQIPLWLLKKYNRDLNLLTLRPGALFLVPNIAEKSEHTPPSLIDTEIDPAPIPPFEIPQNGTEE